MGRILVFADRERWNQRNYMFVSGPKEQEQMLALLDLSKQLFIGHHTIHKAGVWTEKSLLMLDASVVVGPDDNFYDVTHPLRIRYIYEVGRLDGFMQVSRKARDSFFENRCALHVESVEGGWRRKVGAPLLFNEGDHAAFDSPVDQTERALVGLSLVVNWVPER